jgi:DNA-binding transcriptional regulator WhiA
MNQRDTNTAYIIGVALGDGNLSNPNKRAVRLRVTCDNKYPEIMSRIAQALQILLPQNKVSLYRRKDSNCTDVYGYSNALESILGWRALEGSKYIQRVRVPDWIFSKDEYMRLCLQGLFETDGSVYKDRVYTYANFTSIIPGLAFDVKLMINKLGYSSTTQHTVQKNGKYKFVVRVCKQCSYFLKEIQLQKK